MITAGLMYNEKGTLRTLLNEICRKFSPDLYTELKRNLSGYDKVLDLGCGYASALHQIHIQFSVGVELFEPYILESSRRGIHSQYIKADVRRIEFKPKTFDAVIAIDLLEHLAKQEGAELLAKMESWATKKVIIFTPNGYLWQDACDDNTLQEHRSGWSVDELQGLGYTVRGMNGWRRLRGYRTSAKYHPVLLWDKISILSQMITYWYPRLAFQLLAIKWVKGTARK
jgi:SAM-dependent methyltransferase